MWSYTDARYQPPPPYVVPNGDHVPFAIAAVELAHEGLVVLGQVVAGVSFEDLRVGQEMELVIDVLFSDDDTDHLIWKWKPAAEPAVDDDSDHLVWKWKPVDGPASSGATTGQSH